MHSELVIQNNSIQICVLNIDKVSRKSGQRFKRSCVDKIDLKDRRTDRLTAESKTF